MPERTWHNSWYVVRARSAVGSLQCVDPFGPSPSSSDPIGPFRNVVQKHGSRVGSCRAKSCCRCGRHRDGVHAEVDPKRTNKKLGGRKPCKGRLRAYGVGWRNVWHLCTIDDDVARMLRAAVESRSGSCLEMVDALSYITCSCCLLTLAGWLHSGSHATSRRCS